MKTPELDKMSAARETSQTIGSFLDWLCEHNMMVCERHLESYNHEYWPVRCSIEQLLAEYYEIDLNKVEEERQGILAELRSSK